MELLTSPTNVKVKFAISLQQKKNRDKQKVFMLEGLRNAEMAVEAKADLQMCFCTDKILENSRANELIAKIEELKCPVYQLPEHIYAKLSDTDSPQGLMLIIKQKAYALNDLALSEKSFLLVLDRLQDPGNIGTLIRTADAMGVSAVICLNGTADIFSPKVVRSAMGSLFNLPICHKIKEDDLLSFAKEHDLKLYATALDEQAKPSWSVNYQEKNICAVILGNEANGISAKLLHSADERIYIPMQGNAESLNVANAGAMIIYERCRQINKNN